MMHGLPRSLDSIECQSSAAMSILIESRTSSGSVGHLPDLKPDQPREQRSNHELTLMHTKAETTDHSGYTGHAFGLRHSFAAYKGRANSYLPGSRLRGFVIRHSDFACHAVLSRRSFSADGSLERRRVIFPIRDIRATELMGSAR